MKSIWEFENLDIKSSSHRFHHIILYNCIKLGICLRFAFVICVFNSSPKREIVPKNMNSDVDWQHIVPIDNS